MWGATVSSPAMAGTLSRNYAITIVMEFKPASYTNAAGFLSRIGDSGSRLLCIQEDGGLRSLNDAEALAGGPDREWMMFLRRD